MQSYALHGRALHGTTVVMSFWVELCRAAGIFQARLLESIQGVPGNDVLDVLCLLVTEAAKPERARCSKPADRRLGHSVSG